MRDIEARLSSLLSLDFQRTVAYNDNKDLLSPEILPRYGCPPAVKLEGGATGEEGL